MSNAIADTAPVRSDETPDLMQLGFILAFLRDVSFGADDRLDISPEGRTGLYCVLDHCLKLLGSSA